MPKDISKREELLITEFKSQRVREPGRLVERR